MKNNLRTITILIVIISTASLVCGAGLAQPIQAVLDSARTILVDGKMIDTQDTGVLVYNDRTYIPARALAEALGANVSWDEATQTVIVTPAGKEPVVVTPPVSVTSENQQAPVNFTDKLDLSELKPIADKYLGPAAKGSYEGPAEGAMCVLKADFEEITKTMKWDIEELGGDTFYLMTINAPGYGKFATDGTALVMKQVGKVLRDALVTNGWVFDGKFVNGNPNDRIYIEENINDELFIKGEFVLRLRTDRGNCSIYIDKGEG